MNYQSCSLFNFSFVFFYLKNTAAWCFFSLTNCVLFVIVFSNIPQHVVLKKMASIWLVIHFLEIRGVICISNLKIPQRVGCVGPYLSLQVAASLNSLSFIHLCVLNTLHCNLNHSHSDVKVKYSCKP